jgi:hypothetical protein
LKKYEHLLKNRKANETVLFSIVFIWIKYFQNENIDDIFNEYNITGHDTSITFIKNILNKLDNPIASLNAKSNALTAKVMHLLQKVMQ